MKFVILALVFVGSIVAAFRASVVVDRSEARGIRARFANPAQSIYFAAAVASAFALVGTIELA